MIHFLYVPTFSVLISNKDRCEVLINNIRILAYLIHSRALQNYITPNLDMSAGGGLDFVDIASGQPHLLQYCYYSLADTRLLQPDANRS